MDIKADEALWATSIMPEGLLERWVVPDGAPVTAGQRVAELRIEGALHEVMAPATGHLVHVAMDHAVIEPGNLLGTIADT